MSFYMCSHIFVLPILGGSLVSILLFGEKKKTCYKTVGLVSGRMNLAKINLKVSAGPL